MPRPRALATATWSRADLPIPGGPSIETTAGAAASSPPAAAPSISSPSALCSRSRTHLRVSCSGVYVLAYVEKDQCRSTDASVSGVANNRRDDTDTTAPDTLACAPGRGGSGRRRSAAGRGAGARRGDRGYVDHRPGTECRSHERHLRGHHQWLHRGLERQRRLLLVHLLADRSGSGDQLQSRWGRPVHLELLDPCERPDARPKLRVRGHAL